VELIVKKRYKNVHNKTDLFKLIDEVKSIKGMEAVKRAGKIPD
jgi:hypothetical protein